MLKNYAILICFLIATSSCNKENDLNSDINGENLRTGLISKNENIIRSELAKITDALMPVSSDSDLIGHNENLKILLKRINSVNGISAEILCYACIETYPAQSEIFILLDSAGKKVSRIIDISTPHDTVLSFKRIHNYSSNFIE